VANLEDRDFCRPHFIHFSYEAMDHYERRIKEHRFRDAVAELMRRFLTACTKQATDLAQTSKDLENLERAQLLDLLRRADELSRYLRRSPRKPANIEITLSSQRLGHAWEEKTRTLMLSRFGALVECQTPLENGETLLLTRVADGRQCRIRVAWSRRTPPGAWEVGIEFANSEDFWEIDWNALEPGP
jgi:hypothetical protein